MYLLAVLRQMSIMLNRPVGRYKESQHKKWINRTHERAVNSIINNLSKAAYWCVMKYGNQITAFGKAKTLLKLT